MADNLASLTHDWLTKASHDLQNARSVSAAAEAPLDTAIYHCQQAAEKSLKGWLAWRGIALVKTHDLIQLVAAAADLNPDFAMFEKPAEVLTPYVSAFRYPGITADPMPTRAEFDAALQHAQAIYDFVLNQLPKEARP